jgi:hypothetical protein
MNDMERHPGDIVLWLSSLQKRFLEIDWHPLMDREAMRIQNQFS